MSKITLSTIKSFINKNGTKLYINQKSKFNGMIDGVQEVNGDFVPLTISKRKNPQNDLGFEGIWIVGSGSGNLFSFYEDKDFIGYEIYNCCGTFVLALPKQKLAA
jgi:hypothetical protein